MANPEEDLEGEEIIMIDCDEDMSDPLIDINNCKARTQHAKCRTTKHQEPNPNIGTNLEGRVDCRSGEPTEDGLSNTTDFARGGIGRVLTNQVCVSTWS